MKNVRSEDINFLIDKDINKYLLYYQLKHIGHPDYINDTEWEDIISDMVNTSSLIYLNDKKLTEESDFEKICEINSESYALRDKLFTLINYYWEELTL